MNKTDYDFKVTKATNGFIVYESYRIPAEDPQVGYNYKSDHTICPTWADVVKFVETHEIKE